MFKWPTCSRIEASRAARDRSGSDGTRSWAASDPRNVVFLANEPLRVAETEYRDDSVRVHRFDALPECSPAVVRAGHSAERSGAGLVFCPHDVRVCDLRPSMFVVVAWRERGADGLRAAAPIERHTSYAVAPPTARQVRLMRADRLRARRPVGAVGLTTPVARVCGAWGFRRRRRRCKRRRAKSSILTRGIAGGLIGLGPASSLRRSTSSGSTSSSPVPPTLRGIAQNPPPDSHGWGDPAAVMLAFGSTWLVGRRA